MKKEVYSIIKLKITKIAPDIKTISELDRLILESNIESMFDVCINPSVYYKWICIDDVVNSILNEIRNKYIVDENKIGIDSRGNFFIEE